MVAVVYLDDNTVKASRVVDNDKECNQLLQELRTLTGEDWIVRTFEFTPFRSLSDRLMGRQIQPIQYYSLYADCHGEWQEINCISADNHGTVFGDGEGSREAIMNFMLGYISALTSIKSKQLHQRIKDNWQYEDGFPETIDT